MRDLIQGFGGLAVIVIVIAIAAVKWDPDISFSLALVSRCILAYFLVLAALLIGGWLAAIDDPPFLGG